MAFRSRRDTKAGIAAAVTHSPAARHLVRANLLLAACAIKTGAVVVHGTRNLQEASKHVTRFGNAGLQDGRAR